MSPEVNKHSHHNEVEACAWRRRTVSFWHLSLRLQVWREGVRMARVKGNELARARLFS